MSRNVPGHSFAKRLRTALVALPLVTAGLVVGTPQTAQADVYAACTAAELVNAINLANASPDPSTINLNACLVLVSVADSSGVLGNTAFPAITSPITIDGGGGVIDKVGTAEFRYFLVSNTVESSLTLRDLVLTGGVTDGVGAAGSGGAILNRGELTLDLVQVFNNLAATGDGGGVYNSGVLRMTSSVFEGNAATGNGGALYNAAAATVILDRSTVTDNSSLASGGGVFNGDVMIIAASTISGNDAVASGGGLFNATNGNSSLDDTTVSGNHALVNGGGVANVGSLSTDSSTVAGNSAAHGGALHNSSVAQATVTNSIFSDSVADADVVNSGSAQAVGPNIVESSVGLVLDNSLEVDPGLLPLDANGGPTLTHALGVASAAIDAGATDLTTDQRGTARPQGAADDIGAFEVQVDVDTDADGEPDSTDNCPASANPDQANLDGDALGDVCDPFPSDPNNASGDVDGDGVLDNADNCRGIPNSVQEDTDGDAIGNICDYDPFDPTNVEDTDGDTVADPFDNCPSDENPDQANADGDAVGDACDTLPQDPGNNGDTDVDFAADGFDNCVLVPNPEQLDTDNDNIGDACDLQPLDSTNDPDDDNDGVSDGEDNCPNADNAGQENADADTEGDACDADDDNDGVVDAEDAFPLDAAESVDTDGDDVGNNADTDDDGDGVSDGADAFPLDPTESLDTDGDQIGNNADTDDDGDGIPDTEEYRDLLIQVRADLAPFSSDRNLRQGADLVAKAVAAKYWSSNGGFLVPKTADQARRLLRQAIDRLSKVTGPPATLAAAQAAITRIEDILAALV